MAILYKQTREAQQRMAEMRHLIGKRFEGESTPRSRAGTLPNSPAPRITDPSADGVARTLQDIVSETDQHLTRAATNHETMRDDLKLLASDFKEVGRSNFPLRSVLISLHALQKPSDLEKTRVELQNSRRQCELVKSLLADATAEKEIMYEVWTIHTLLPQSFMSRIRRPSTKS